MHKDTDPGSINCCYLALYSLILWFPVKTQYFWWERGNRALFCWYIRLFFIVSSASKSPCMEYFDKFNTNARKDVGIESILYVTTKILRFYIYIIFIQVTLNSFVLFLFWRTPFTGLVQTQTLHLLVSYQVQPNNHHLFPVSHVVFAFQKRKFWSH